MNPPPGYSSSLSSLSERSQPNPAAAIAPSKPNRIGLTAKDGAVSPTPAITPIEGVGLTSFFSISLASVFPASASRTVRYRMSSRSFCLPLGATSSFIQRDSEDGATSSSLARWAGLTGASAGLPGISSGLSAPCILFNFLETNVLIFATYHPSRGCIKQFHSKSEWNILLYSPYVKPFSSPPLAIIEKGIFDPDFTHK